MLPTNLNRTAYEVLGIPTTATQDDVAKAHRTLMRKFHPDLNPHADQNHAKTINEAFDNLKNAAARDTYNASLRHAPTGNTGDTDAATPGDEQPYIPAGDLFDYADTKNKKRKK